jgi:gas vesicle protein
MSRTTSNTIIALLTGAVIGAGIGILYAPAKGSKTRKKIKDGFDHSKEDAIDKYNELVGLLKTKTASAKEHLEESLENFVSNGSHKAEDLILYLEDKLEALRKQNAKLQK